MYGRRGISRVGLQEIQMGTGWMGQIIVDGSIRQSHLILPARRRFLGRLSKQVRGGSTVSRILPSPTFAQHRALSTKSK